MLSAKSSYRSHGTGIGICDLRVTGSRQTGINGFAVMIEQPSPFSEYEAKHPHLVGNCLVLKAGEYGKFWGCETFKATGCKCTRDTTEQAEEKLHNNLMAAVYRDAGGPF